MIYKFNDKEKNLEIELLSEKTVIFSIFNECNNPVRISLSKKDIYHLIGSLHLLQKEMK
jgi:hypothetical protein